MRILSLSRASFLGELRAGLPRLKSTNDRTRLQIEISETRIFRNTRPTLSETGSAETALRRAKLLGLRGRYSLETFDSERVLQTFTLGNMDSKVRECHLASTNWNQSCASSASFESKALSGTLWRRAQVGRAVDGAGAAELVEVKRSHALDEHWTRFMRLDGLAGDGFGTNFAESPMRTVSLRLDAVGEKDYFWQTKQTMPRLCAVCAHAWRRLQVFGNSFEPSVGCADRAWKCSAGVCGA